MTKKVYMFRIEVEGLEGSKMPKRATGAFVNCVVPGENTSDAERLLRKTLKQDKYKLIGIDKIENFDSLVFDKKNQHYLQMAKDALKFNEVYYGEFNIWEK